MNVIWKVKLTGADQEFDAPAEALALRCTVQQMSDGMQPVMYLLCDRQAPPAKHSIKLVPTAMSFGDEIGAYVDTITVMAESGPLVLHVFWKQLGIIKTS